jgi:hypothetical protein
MPSLFWEYIELQCLEIVQKIEADQKRAKELSQTRNTLGNLYQPGKGSQL